MLMALGGLMVLAVAIASIWTLTDKSPKSVRERFGDGEALLNLSLEALRASVGTDNLNPGKDSAMQQWLATIASLTGALVPAVLLGIVLIKLFSLRPFVWRRRASISHAWAADFPGYARLHATSDHAIIAVRFYNRFDNLSVVDLRARAHLRFLEPSPNDGSLVIYKKWLKVLDEKGEPADERSWLAVERGAPFTVWIPVEAPVPRLPVHEIQGKDLSASHGAKLLVRLTARTIGMGTEVVDERWFDLEADDFEIGRFVPVEANLMKDVWVWRGWRGFDGLLPDEGSPPAPEPGEPDPAPDADAAPAPAVPPARGSGVPEEPPGASAP